MKHTTQYLRTNNPNFTQIMRGNMSHVIKNFLGSFPRERLIEVHHFKETYFEVFFILFLLTWMVFLYLWIRISNRIPSDIKTRKKHNFIGRSWSLYVFLSRFYLHMNLPTPFHLSSKENKIMEEGSKEISLPKKKHVHQNIHLLRKAPLHEKLTSGSHKTHTTKKAEQISAFLLHSSPAPPPLLHPSPTTPPPFTPIAPPPYVSLSNALCLLQVCGLAVLGKENIMRHAAEQHEGRGAYQCQYCKKVRFGMILHGPLPGPGMRFLVSGAATPEDITWLILRVVPGIRKSSRKYSFLMVIVRYITVMVMFHFYYLFCFLSCQLGLRYFSKSLFHNEHGKDHFSIH